MPYDVFISHSSQDKVAADAVTHALEAEGIRCWIAPRDIRPGETWGSAILEAIGKTRIMVVIFSTHSNQSTQVMREVERAVQRDRIVIPFRIELCDPSGDMEYFLSATHWLDALEPDREQQIAELVETVRSFTEARGSDPDAEVETVPEAVVAAPTGASSVPLPSESATSPQPLSAAPGPAPSTGVAVGPSPAGLARLGGAPRSMLLAAVAVAVVLALVSVFMLRGEDGMPPGLAVMPGADEIEIAEGHGVDFRAEITDPTLHPDPKGLRWLLDGVVQQSGLEFRFEPGFDLGGSVRTVALQAEASDGQRLRREWQVAVVDVPQLQLSVAPSEPRLRLRPGATAEFHAEATNERGEPMEVALRWLLDGDEQSTAEAWSWEIGPQEAGSHTVTMVASDADGNVLEQREWQVAVRDADVAAGPRGKSDSVIERSAEKFKDTMFGIGDRLRGKD